MPHACPGRSYTQTSGGFCFTSTLRNAAMHRKKQLYTLTREGTSLCSFPAHSGTLHQSSSPSGLADTCLLLVTTIENGKWGMGLTLPGKMVAEAEAKGYLLPPPYSKEKVFWKCRAEVDLYFVSPSCKLTSHASVIKQALAKGERARRAGKVKDRETEGNRLDFTSGHFHKL